MTKQQIRILQLSRKKPRTLKWLCRRLRMSYDQMVNAIDDDLNQYVNINYSADEWDDYKVEPKNRGITFLEERKVEQRRWAVPVIISCIALLISIVAILKQ